MERGPGPSGAPERTGREDRHSNFYEISDNLEARAYKQNETFDAAVLFARAEGIIPPPEPAHAIRSVIEEAQAAREPGESRVIPFGLCGHGHFDLSAYEAYLAAGSRTPSSPKRT